MAPRHARIGDDQVGRVAGGGGKSAPAAAHRLDPAPGRAEHPYEPVPRVGVGLANQDARRMPVRRADQRPDVGAAGQDRGKRLLRRLATRLHRGHILALALGDAALGNAGSP